jgi:hypothetical protein
MVVLYRFVYDGMSPSLAALLLAGELLLSWRVAGARCFSYLF